MKNNQNTVFALVAIPVVGGAIWMLTRAANAANTNQILKNLDVDFKNLRFVGIKESSLVLEWELNIANPLDRTLSVDYINLEARYNGRKLADIDFKSSAAKSLTIQAKGFQSVKFNTKTSIPTLIVNVGIEILAALANSGSYQVAPTANISGNVWLNSQRFNINKDVPIMDIKNAVEDIKKLLKK